MCTIEMTNYQKITSTVEVYVCYFIVDYLLLKIKKVFITFVCFSFPEMFIKLINLDVATLKEVEMSIIKFSNINS